MIAIIDYGMGNIGSIANMIKKVGFQSKVAQSEKDLEGADKVILPGVGAFDTAIQQLKALHLYDALNEFALVKKKPVLGICLGMQLICNRSEEGVLPGFGWIDADVKKFNFSNTTGGEKLKIPHIGWNVVKPVDEDFVLFKNHDDEMRFYFVHSYAAQCNDPEQSKGKTVFGYEYDSVIGKNNIMGMQCHPEKSHKFGMKVYKNFCEM
jgi:imidazole glycerol-phosphate synthase subunit HisH